MPYDQYANAYVDANGKPLPGAKVLQSCIQSAEEIIKKCGTRSTTL